MPTEELPLTRFKNEKFEDDVELTHYETEPSEESVPDASSTQRGVFRGPLHSRVHVRYTYRGDGRAPTKIHLNGMQSRGTNLDKLSHACPKDVVSLDTAYIATSKSKTVAEGFASTAVIESGEGYTYVINPQDNAVEIAKELYKEKRISKYRYNRLKAEYEMAVPFEIKGQDIKGAWCQHKQAKFIHNPIYVAPLAKVTAAIKVVGYGLTTIGVTIDGCNLYFSYQDSQKMGNPECFHGEIAKVTGGWSGAVALGKLCGEVGAVTFSSAGPWTSLVAGLLYGFVGSIVGYNEGSELAQKIRKTLSSSKNASEAQKEPIPQAGGVVSSVIGSTIPEKPSMDYTKLIPLGDDTIANFFVGLDSPREAVSPPEEASFNPFAFLLPSILSSQLHGQTTAATQNFKAKDAEEPSDEVIPSTTETEASLQDNIPALPSSNADEVLDRAEKVFSAVQNYKADKKKYPDASQVERVASTAAQTLANINVRTEAAFVGAAIGFVAGIPLGPVGSAMGEVIGGFVGATWSGSIADDAGEIANKATHDLFRQQEAYRPTPEAAPRDYTIPRRETSTEKAYKAEARQSHETSHTSSKEKPPTKAAAKPSQNTHTVLPAAYQGKAKPKTFSETLSQFHTKTQRAAGLHADQTEVGVADAGNYRQRQENILTSMRSASVTAQRREVPRGRSSTKGTQQEKPPRAQSAERWCGIRVNGWPSSKREYIDDCKKEHVRLQNKVKMNIPLNSVEEWFLSKLPFASASAADRPKNHSNGSMPQHASRNYTIQPEVARHNSAEYYPRIDPTSTHPITNVALPAPHHETNAMTATLNAAERNQLIEAKQSMQLHAQQRKEASTTRTMQLHTTQEAFSTASSVFGITASVSRYTGNQEAAAFLSSVSQITSGISTLLVAKTTIAAAGHLSAGAAFGLLTGGLSLVAGLVSLIALFDDSEAAEARAHALMIEKAFSALQTANQDISDEIHEFVRLLQQEVRALGALSSDVLASQGTAHQMNVLAFDGLDVLQSLMTMHMDSFNAYFQALLKGSLKHLCYQLQSHLDGTGVQPSPKQIATSLSQLEYWLMCELYNPALTHTALLHISAESITKLLQQQSLPFINMPSFMAGRMRMVLGKTVPLAFLSLPPMTSYFPSVQLYCKVLERNPEYLSKDKGKTVFEQIKNTLMIYGELFVFLKENEIVIQQSQLTAIEKEIIGAVLKESADYETGIQQMLAIVDQYQQVFSQIQPILTDAEKVLETIACQFFFPHGTPEVAPCFWTKKLAPSEQKGTSYLLDCSVFDEDLSYRRNFINKLQEHQLKATRIDIGGQPYLQVTLNTQTPKTNTTPVTLVHSTLFFSSQNNFGENKLLLNYQ